MFVALLVGAEISSANIVRPTPPASLDKPILSFDQKTVLTTPPTQSHQTISNALPNVQLEQKLCKKIVFSGSLFARNVCATKAQWLLVQQTQHVELIQALAAEQ